MAPRFDEKVLARRDKRWVGARIKGLSKGVIRVLWEDSQVLSDTSISEIGPQPPIDFVPTVGTYVLARPTPGSRTWVLMRIESASQLSLVLSDEMGEPYQMAPRDVLPLDRGPVGE